MSVSVRSLLRNVCGPRFAPLAVLLAVPFVGSCAKDLSGPSLRPGYLVLAPSFPSAASGIVDVDHIHVTLTRTADSTVVLDSVIQSSPDDSIVDLSFRIRLTSSEETFWLFLQCLTEGGEVVFEAGPMTVIATTSSDVEPENIEVEYVGVGFDAAMVRIVSQEPSVEFGDTLALAAEALDSAGVPIEGTPIKWISSDTGRVTVPDPGVGRVAGGTERGPALVEARLLTGQADTIEVLVLPVPSGIQVVSGDGQVGDAETELGALLVVEVTAEDGLGVADVTVDFTSADEGRFEPASAITDSDGLASTSWTLGPAVGSQAALASVRGSAGIQTTFSAVASGPQVGVWWINSNGGNWNTPANWSTGAVPGANDTASITLPGDYTVQLDTDATVAFLTVGSTSGTQTLLDSAYTLTVDTSGAVLQNGVLGLEGGTLAGSGTVVVEGGLNMTSGGSLTGTGFTVVDATGVMTVSPGPGGVLLDTRTLENRGTIVFTTDLTGSNGATIINDEVGLLDMQGSAGFGYNYVGDVPTAFNQGTIRVSGGALSSTVFDAILDNSGQLEVQDNSTLRLQRGSRIGGSATLGQNSLLDFIGNPSPPFIEQLLRDGFTATGPGLTRFGGPYGIVFVEAGGTVSLENAAVEGAISVDGTLVVTSSLTTDGAFLLGTGSLDLSAATFPNFVGEITPGVGNLGPVYSVGRLTILGDFPVDPQSQLTIQLGGTIPASDYDQLSVSGTATLGGGLSIGLVNNFTPVLGDTFAVLAYGDRSGNFSSVGSSQLGGTLAFDTVFTEDTLFLAVVDTALTTGEWTWISGSSNADQAGVYGTQGVASPSNVPGARHGVVSWIDVAGDMWLFGGFGRDAEASLEFLNDLWHYDGSNWTWISGSSSGAQSGVYGTQGTADPSNIPGAREDPGAWIDGIGNFWLFGGHGDGAAGSFGYLNDLWRFDGTNWTWISGSTSDGQVGVYGTQGTADPANVPGARTSPVSWIDANGDMWLFGGFGVDAVESLGFLNDLWRFDGTNWTWISGSSSVDQVGVYGTQGVASPSNVPGGRWGSVSWIDAAGNLWLMGGAGSGVGFNDLWRFDGTNWTWMSGSSSTGQPGVYGTQGTASPTNVPGARKSAVSWIDDTGGLWLFGGEGHDAAGAEGYLNDLWRFDGANWTWVSGSTSVDQPGVYGTQGTASPSNVPGGRTLSVSWIDGAGNLWLFGGFGYDLAGTRLYLNDLWSYGIP